jgi:hypothetical protein
MATRPLSIIVSIIGLAGTLLVGACAEISQAKPRYGVCRQQITDYVEQQLGQTMTRIDVRSYAERMPPRLFEAGDALVYVTECDGFHSFEIRATEDFCEHLPHYGTSSARFIRYEGAFEGC